MPTDFELVMYTRTRGCPFVSVARLALSRTGVPYREINIDQDPNAHAWLLQTVGFLSVPTLVITRPGEDIPYTAPEPLPTGASPRGIDRGPLITEPSGAQLKAWLHRNGFVTEVY